MHKGALEALPSPANQRSSIQRATLCEKIVPGVIDGAQRPHVSAQANHCPAAPTHSHSLAGWISSLAPGSKPRAKPKKKCTSHQDGGPQYIEQLRPHTAILMF